MTAIKNKRFHVFSSIFYDIALCKNAQKISSWLEGGSFCFSAQLISQEVSEGVTEDNLTYYFCKSVSDQKQQISVKYTMLARRNELILSSHQGLFVLDMDDRHGWSDLVLSYFSRKTALRT